MGGYEQITRKKPEKFLYIWQKNKKLRQWNWNCCEIEPYSSWSR